MGGESAARAAEIATFLARCWSGDAGAAVSFSRGPWRARGPMRVAPMDALSGTGIDRYRQLRANVWHAAMRRRHGGPEMSGDHAFGFVLNALEVRRTEIAGLAEWRGMAGEVIFNHAFQWLYRPLLNEVHGRPRAAEAFLQEFLFGGTKGDVSDRQLGAARRAARAGAEAVEAALGGDGGALEAAVPAILAELELDPLAGIPVAFPWSRPDMPLGEDDMPRSIARVESAMGTPAPSRGAAVPDDDVLGEYESIRARAGGGAGRVLAGLRVPPREDVDESAIYDRDLIARLKTRFRDWQSRWSESHGPAGDELDAEAYAESGSARAAFVRDERREIDADVMMLLDHSSSVAPTQLAYKKAALALCEVLAMVRARFSVYAFSTSERSVTCWEVKRASQRWEPACARRLAQIAANGSTPLDEVYAAMAVVVAAERPRTLLTMTDGEPSNAGAVREAVMRARSGGTRMAALGLGPDSVRATAIASNLAGLGYERAVAVSRLGDIPGKVMRILGE
ncbi:MAG: VWA domain-containing protein [Thaumarchaeota archaeon]|nr:VWA domain-containing protein [Nitrososphaerota archaeon]